MRPNVVGLGPRDLVARVMEERGVSGNSRDYVLFCADGCVTDRHGNVARFTGEVPVVYRAGGPAEIKLMHKRNLWCATSFEFARSYWHQGRSV